MTTNNEPVFLWCENDPVHPRILYALVGEKAWMLTFDNDWIPSVFKAKEILKQFREPDRRKPERYIFAQPHELAKIPYRPVPGCHVAEKAYQKSAKDIDGANTEPAPAPVLGSLFSSPSMGEANQFRYEFDTTEIATKIFTDGRLFELRRAAAWFKENLERVEAHIKRLEEKQK